MAVTQSRLTQSYVKVKAAASSCSDSWANGHWYDVDRVSRLSRVAWEKQNRASERNRIVARRTRKGLAVDMKAQCQETTISSRISSSKCLGKRGQRPKLKNESNSYDGYRLQVSKD